MAQAAARDTDTGEAVAAYKRMLASIIERRPSGTRQRLADALSKNRSFVSQITSTSYATPIPALHLDTIFEVCHFSRAERRDFLAIYARAHPRRLPAPTTPSNQPTRSVTLPDLGDEARNARLHAMVSDFVTRLAQLLDETNGRGKRQ